MRTSHTGQASTGVRKITSSPKNTDSKVRGSLFQNVVLEVVSEIRFKLPTSACLIHLIEISHSRFKISLMGLDRAFLSMAQMPRRMREPQA